MQWLIDIIIEAVKTKVGYTYRGDPVAHDFTAVDFTMDNAWHTLTLPAFVPLLARAVHLELTVSAPGINRTVILKRAGNANDINVARLRTQVANIRNSEDCSVTMQSGTRNIEYLISAAGLTRCDLDVKGWWL